MEEAPIKRLRLLFLLLLVSIDSATAQSNTTSSRTGQVNLWDLGAVCDGVSDVGPAFSQAIDLLKSGGTIHIPAGVCYVSQSVEITKDNVTIEGAGLGATVIVPGPGAKHLFAVHPLASSTKQIVFPSFRNFSVDGAKSHGVTAFYIRSARYIFIDHIFTTNCFISYWVDRSWKSEAPFTSTFHLSSFQIDNTPDDPAARGILINGAGDDWFLSSGRIFENSQAHSNVGMELRSGAGFMIQNIDISSMGRSFVVDPGKNEVIRFGQITGLQCDTSWGDAALLDGTSAFASGYPNGIYNLVFVNCWFASAGVNGGEGNGINLRSARGITIEASQILSNSLNGILIGKDSEDINILNNQVSGNSNGIGNKNRTRGQYSGIATDDGAKLFSISGNRIGQQVFFDNSQMFGIRIGRGADHYQLLGNHLTRNIQSSIHEESSQKGQSRVVSNLDSASK